MTASGGAPSFERVLRAGVPPPVFGEPALRAHARTVAGGAAPEDGQAGALGLGGGNARSGGAHPPTNLIVPCAENVKDVATGACVPTSSMPTEGALYPLGSEFMVTASGVGVGTSTPAYELDVVGTGRMQGLVLEGGATTTPITVSTQALNPNLNADLLDGLEASAFSQLGDSIEDAEVAADAAIQGTKIEPSFGAQEISTTGMVRVWNSTESIGVNSNVYGSGFSTGVYGASQSNHAGSSGVSGVSLALSGPTYGVWGSSNSRQGAGVHGAAFASSGLTTLRHAVLAELTGGGGGTAVFAEADAPVTIADGVTGRTNSPNSYGVYGVNTSDGIAIRGWASGGGVAVFAQGDSVTTGTKSFAQPHPTDPSREIRFVCLEGNESGTYFRGSIVLAGGRAEVDVPEEFRLVTAAEGLTVQLTAVGSPARVWVESRGLERIVVRGDLDCEVDDFANGLRRGFEDHEPIAKNRSFIPRRADEPYGLSLPEPLRRDLVRSGVLEPDFTPDRATAAAPGWLLEEPAPVEPDERAR